MSIKPPKPLLVNSDIDMSQEWTEWLEVYENYFTAAKVNKEEAGVQTANFLAIIGRDALKVINNLGLSNDEKKELATIKTKLTQHFAPAKNKTYERCQFHRIKQQQNESFESFLQKLQTQVRKCSYGNKEDEFTMDQIVVGIHSDATRQKLWTEEELDFVKTKKICRAAERATKQISEIQDGANASTSAYVNALNNDEVFQCKRCGTTHGYRSCPAFNKKCKKCGTKGHFESMCKSNSKKDKKVKENSKKYKKYKNKKEKKVHCVESDSDSEDENDSDESSDSDSDEPNQFKVGLVIIENKKSKKEFKVNLVDEDEKWSAKVRVGEKELQLKLDTGAQCNVLSKNVAKELKAKIEKSTTKRLIAYNNKTIKVIGETFIACEVKNKFVPVLFKIVKKDVPSILGGEMCEKLGFIVRVHRINDPAENELGCCNNFVYDIDFIENPNFKIIPARRIAHALRDKVKKELDKMVKLKVIEQITEPTPAVSPMVIVNKGEKTRICMDPTELNKNIKRRHYPLKTVEEIAAKVRNAKYFTKLDCLKGFWQLKVTERTSKYLTMATPWGRYRYFRLPFGISSAPEIFSEVMNRTLNGIDNCEVAMDDLFIYAKTIKELENRTKIVIDRLTQTGFTLNKAKCEFNKKRVKFLGHIFTQNGCEADPEKIEAIKQLKIPKNVTELQRLLGMINYLGIFIANLSELTAPLRKLLHKDVEWFWDAEQQEGFENIKRTLTTTPVLKYYDVNQDVKLSVDASSHSMGACLMQEGRPVAYATRAFTKSQQNYPQIEKEAMAIKFACIKFHQYVYGKRLEVETDHKPLETIFKKPLQNAPLRLQKILWDVLQYSPTVKYVKGLEIPIADTLSRDCNPNEYEEEEQYAVNIVLAMTKEAEQRFIEATQNDFELRSLKAIVQRGWPDEDDQLPKAIKKYATFKEEITYENGLLFKAHKVIVPESEIQNIIKQVHTGHAGITKSLARARQSLYWYGQTNDITNYVEKCAACQSTQRSNVREPMLMKTVPDYPFQHVSSDIFYFKGDEFLLIADHYSGFIDFRELKASTSAEVIQHFKQWFSIHGIPEILETDGGPQYASRKFADFARDWNFTHRMSSPYYPRSNGFAERNVQTAKNLMKQAYLDNTDVYKALLMLRNTPRNNTLKSPCQRLFSRSTRTMIPTDREQLKPKVVESVTDELRNLRLKQKHYVDRVASPFEQLKIGDKVRMQKGHRDWTSAKVVNETEYPRSVIVQTNDGRRYRRNNHHLHKTKANIHDPNIEWPSFDTSEAKTSTSLDNAGSTKTTATTEDQMDANRSTHDEPTTTVSATTSTKTNAKTSKAHIPTVGPYITRSGRVSKSNPRYMQNK